ncbi:ROK family protein [Microbacterium sp. No. 7]|uniref:ROK family protein n=1 Tax=Microbacterium sp. No. 7 TaxID=1714373 RepID=UPI0006D1D996|nr:ROK family protein [Microbacterium sp. No. 7]ALJ19190.1 sugar kinase [Microbacterium sp. No. 7]
MHLGFDVGGTKTDAVAALPSGEIVARARRATGWGADAVVATIVALSAELATAAGCRVDEVSSVGVGMPGQVAPGSAVVTHAVNLGVDRLDVAAALAAHVPAPVRAENDVKAAAVGAAALRTRGRAGGGTDAAGFAGGADAAVDAGGEDAADVAVHAAGRATMAYLNLGTGIAAGIVRDGALWRGAHGTAGEVGHISVDPGGPECRCGQRGCIEAFAGGGAVARRWGRSGALPVRDVFDAADAGDAAAVALRDDVAYGVAAAVRVLVLTLDADEVVIGGGLTALGDRMLGRVVDQLSAADAASPFLRSLRLADRIHLLPPGSPAAALGAALIGARHQEVLVHG